MREKGTALHAATVIGDTVGDPFKDTTSVALNPIIKFSTLFGLLAMEIAILMKYFEPKAGDSTEGMKRLVLEGKEVVTQSGVEMYVGTYSGMTWVLALAFLAIGLHFVWRTFYKTRIPEKK
jgi:K(+)-stimulated pyrophosphate-energized sodium pump